jgi:hypothetical protein
VPSETKTTCDICGASGEPYPSFFEIEPPSSAGSYYRGGMSHTEGLQVNLIGVSRYRKVMFLCHPHLETLELAVDAWVKEQRSTLLVGSKDA